MNTHLPAFWDVKLIHLLGGTPTHETLRLLDAWARAEGGEARWNPLNTTLDLPGATAYNTDGVRNYRNAVQGISATAATLTNGYYRGIVGALQSGKLTAKQTVQQNAAEFDKWGTGAAHVEALL